MTFRAQITATGELITLYALRNGNFYDHDNLAAFKPPAATIANKKEFAPHELSHIVLLRKE